MKTHSNPARFFVTILWTNAKIISGKKKKKKLGEIRSKNMLPIFLSKKAFFLISRDQKRNLRNALTRFVLVLYHGYNKTIGTKTTANLVQY